MIVLDFCQAFYQDSTRKLGRDLRKILGGLRPPPAPPSSMLRGRASHLALRSEATTLVSGISSPTLNLGEGGSPTAAAKTSDAARGAS